METNRIVYFSSLQCSVCHVLKPKLKERIQSVYPKMEWVEVMIDDEPATAAYHQIFTVPTVLIEFEAKETFRFVRGFSVSEITKALQRPYDLLFGEE